MTTRRLTELSETSSLVRKRPVSVRRRKTPLVASAATMDEAGREVMRFYLDRVAGHEKKVLRKWDIEEVHNMRVATRRLRVAFRVFRKAFGRKVLEPFLEQLRQMGQDLGGVRDLDVFLEFVNGYGQGLDSAETMGVEWLRAHLDAVREGPKGILAAYLKQDQYHRFKQDFQEWRDGATKYKRKKAGNRLVKEVVPVLLNKLRKHILAYESRLIEDSSSETLHALRIACKHMRYTAEFFMSCYGKRVNLLIGRMTELQDILGRLHDADVHIDYVSNYIKTLDRRSSRQRRVQKELETLIVSEIRIRQDCLDRFHAVWPVAVGELHALDFTL